MLIFSTRCIITKKY